MEAKRDNPERILPTGRHKSGHICLLGGKIQVSSPAYRSRWLCPGGSQRPACLSCGNHLSQWREDLHRSLGSGSDQPADYPGLMFCLNSSHRYHLYRGACDMRKSFNGLSGLVRNQLGRDPASGEVFVFLNRRRTLIKLLHWEAGGYVLYYKRLEQGTFTPPSLVEGRSVVHWPDLVLMIEGIQVQVSRQKLRYQR